MSEWMSLFNLTGYEKNEVQQNLYLHLLLHVWQFFKKLERYHMGLTAGGPMGLTAGGPMQWEVIIML